MLNIKKLAISLSAGAIILAASALPAFASPAADNAQCGTDAASGAFVGGGTGGGKDGNYGWLGELGGTPGYHDAVGQEQPATGYNNSHVCGNTP